MKVFLDGLSKELPSVSLGTRAFMLANMQIIERYIPDVEFVMLSVFPEVEEAYYANGSHRVKILKRSNSQIGSARDYSSIVRDVDAVVSAWGDGYITYPPHRIFYKTSMLKTKSKPVMLFPSSVGPFRGFLKSLLAKKGLSVFDEIMAREPITLNYFKSLGLKNTHLIPDTAFVFEPASDHRVNEILNIEGISTSERYIGVNISQLLNVLYRENLGTSYSEAMKELICYLCDSLGQRVLLIPHQIFPEDYKPAKQYGPASRSGDDRWAIREILSHISNRELVYPLFGDYTPAEYKGIIGRCEIFVGGRMHSVIAALSSGVPAAIIEYSHKAKGVMKMLGMSDYLWNYRDPREDLLNKVQRLWDSRSLLQKDLLQKMPILKEKAYFAGQLIAEAIGKYQ